MALQVVVTGVSGSGKSTVAALLAGRTGCVLADGDAFHPASNIARMAAGQPLDDARRAPWLAALACWLAQRAARGECAVLSCSALTRAYRDRLRAAGPDVRIVQLTGSAQVVAQRLAARRDHFMPPGLLASQYAEFAPLGADEPGITVDLAESPNRIADQILRALGSDRPVGEPT